MPTYSKVQIEDIKVKLATEIEGDQKVPFSIATTPPFSWLLHFTLDPYLIMLSGKQGGIKYHFLSFWYDSTGDRTPGPAPLANTRTIMPMAWLSI